MPLGAGRHKLPVTADLLERVGKQAGDHVSVMIEERVDRAPL
jgi:hypothetical protein